MKLFAREVIDTIERRLKELEIDTEPLTVDELKTHFDRQQVSGDALHFEVELDDTPCALTATVLDQQEADDYGPVRTVSKEVGRLQASGRFVVYHQVMVAPRGTILLDLVGPERSASEMSLEEVAGRFLERLLDHRTVRPLLR
ncbi:MAG: hypothetical protein GY737_08185 [Desulfobacteraceae bacterium]|nr:hypothetical protein [Desulfobacteraceae bacterium]